MVAIVIWYICLLYNAFRVLTDLKGGKSVTIFVAVLILSDMLSSVTIYYLSGGAINRLGLLMS